MRAVWVLVGVLMGAFFGLAVGFTLSDAAIRLPGLDEAELMGLSFLAFVGSILVGAVIGGVLGGWAKRP